MNYKLVTLGVAGVPAQFGGFGGITFLNHSTLLLGGNADNSSGAIYQVPVIRAANGHITAFGTGSLYASAPNIDAGMVFGPNGVLLVADYADNAVLEYKPGSTSPDYTVDLAPLGVSSSPGGLQFVPRGLPGAGGFKILSFVDGQWYDATLSLNGSGTYDVSNVTATVSTLADSEDMIYVPLGSPQFSVPSVLVTAYALSDVYAYPVDSGGNPMGTGSLLLSGLAKVAGSAVDPITGNILLSTESASLNLTLIQGFASGTLAAASGSPQSAVVNQPFSAPLTVLLSDPYGSPMSGVTVTFAAPASGASATLSSTSAVTGSDGTASVTAKAKATAGSYTVTASLYGLSASFSLSNVALSSLTLSPASVVGGTSTTANTVTLTSAAPASGATITLTSTDPTVAAVPASVTVAGGATVSAPFTITTTAVAATTHVTIKASDGTNTKSETLTVKPTALISVKLSPASVVGGKSTTNNTVTLNGPAPAGGAVVKLSSSDPAVARVPASVTVAAGATTSPVFTITTTAVAADTPVTISASYNGTTKDADLTVNAPTVASLRLSPATVVGGRSTTQNTVTLTGPAPTGGAVVMLTSGNSGVADPPHTVTVPSGATTSATFTITTTAVGSSTVVPITATFGGVSKMANLTVNP